jgi:hypothetical protein
MEVGSSIKHIHCAMIRKIVFVGTNYIICEGGQIPNTILEEQLDLWVVVEDAYTDIPVAMLKRAFEKAYTWDSSPDNFIDILDQLIQDFKESSLP